MQPIYQNGNITTRCPDCNGAVITYFPSDSSRSFGSILKDERHHFGGIAYARVLYILFKCAGCGRGGLAKLHDNGHVHQGKVEWFFPTSIERASLPAGIPDGVTSEY